MNVQIKKYYQSQGIAGILSVISGVMIILSMYLPWFGHGFRSIARGDKIFGNEVLFLLIGTVFIVLGVLAVMRKQIFIPALYFVSGILLPVISLSLAIKARELNSYDYMYSGGFFLFFIGGLLLLVAGYMSIKIRRPKELQKKQSIFPIKGTSTGNRPGAYPAEKTIKQRLQELEDLKQDGLISEEEYQEKRKEVLGKL
jgi:uncharacterized membrane protein YgaE (UPF0421/DUF939 family)